MYIYIYIYREREREICIYFFPHSGANTAGHASCVNLCPDAVQHALRAACTIDIYIYIYM